MKVMSVDPALGGGHATVVVQYTEDRLIILDARADYGLSKTEEQLQIISETAKRYRPSRCIIEADAQQKGLVNDDRLAALSGIHGFTVVPHYTRQKKLDIIFGVASMDQAFKKGAIRIPYGDDMTREKMEPLLKQLREWRPPEHKDGRVRYMTKNLRQDLVMALWFAYRNWDDWVQTLSRETAPQQWRPSWLSGQRDVPGLLTTRSA